MSLPGQYSVSSKGAFTYTIPIKVPPGIHRMAPHLAFSYSSQAPDGYLGLGWSISGLSAITRCPSTWDQDNAPGGVTYTLTDRFCLDGKRLIITNGTYGGAGSTYQPEITDYSSITANGQSGNGPASFDVYGRDGIHYEYGDSSDSQILAAPSGNNTVRVWALHRITDTKGNSIVFQYYNASSEYYVTEIDYAYSGSTNLNKITFAYAGRTQTNDVVPMYQAGYLFEVTQLLTDVETYAAPSGGTMAAVFDYHLEYKRAHSGTYPQPSPSHDELTSITLCAGGVTCSYPCITSSGTCLADTSFVWQGSGDVPQTSTNPINLGATYTTVLPADFNGDGITDVFIENSPADGCYPGGPVFTGSIGGTSFTAADISASYYEFNQQGQQIHESGIPCFPYDDSVAADINGDGLSDVAIHIDTWANGQKLPASDALLDGSTGLIQTGNTGQATFPFVLTRANNGLPSDFNNDGLADADAFDTSRNHVYPFLFNLADGNFDEDVSKPLFPNNRTGINADFDGDGCTDVLYQDQNSVYHVNFSPYCNQAGASGNVPAIGGWPFILADVNGDGKADLILANQTNGVCIYLSRGTGFSNTSDTCFANSGSWFNTYTMVPGDFNGDGKQDIAFICNGGGGCTSSMICMSEGLNFASPCMTTTAELGGTATVGDWNSDGAQDLWLQKGSSQELLFSYTPEVVGTIYNGLGATTSVNYQRLNDPANGGVYSNPRSDKYPIQDVNGPYWVPASVTVTGSGTTLTSKYYYTELKKDLLGRGILGFASIAITDPNGKVRTISYRTDFPYIGAVSSDVLTATVNGNPVTIANTQNTWLETTYGGLNGTNYYFPYLEKSVATGGDLDGSLLPEVDTSYTPDAYGNAHIRSIYIPDDGFTSTTTNTYQQNVDPWIVNEITASTTNNFLGASNITRQNTFSPQAATGLILSAKTDTEDQNLELDFALGYDQWGNTNSLTESSPAANGGNFAARTTTASYGTTGEFLASITDALNYTGSFGFDSRFGSQTGFTDPNSISQSWTVDAFGRPSTAVAPSGATVTVTYNYPNTQGHCGPSAVTPSGCAFYSGTTVTAGGAEIAPPSYTYYDSLSRVIAFDKQSFDGATWMRASTTYDSLGRLSTVSAPYFVSSKQTAVTTYGGYDVLNRAATVSYPTDNPAHPTATTTYTYSAKQVTVTDDNTNRTITTRNDEGLVSDVRDANGKDTQYSYDAFGDPIQVKTPAGNLVKNSFDAKGRKYQSTDPDMGIWTYQYDALNELTAQSSQVETNSGQTTNLGYDLLGRLVSRTEPDMAASWTYDTAPHGIGRIAYAQCTSGSACPSGGYKRSYVYDSFGRQISIDIQAGSPSGANYYTSETYDPNTTQLQTVRAFSGFSYSYLYNAQGYMCEIVNYTNAGGTCGGPSMTVFWQANAADAFGHITEETAGNGIVTTRNYSGVTGNLLAITAGPSSNVENASYTWDSLGDLLTRVDNIQDYSDNFCYDPLYRLTNYSVGASNNISCTQGSNLKSMQYDTAGDGNIASKTDIGTYSYAGPGPHAVSSIATAVGKTVDGVTNPNFFYDADGNMQCVTQRTLCDAHAARTYTWTSFDMVEQVAQGTNASSFTYSPEHERIIQTTSTGTLLSANDPVGGVMSERFAGSTITWRTYLLAYGRIVAERFTQGSNVSMLYFAGDHLDSTIALTNGNAPPGIQEQDSYDAWGKRRNDNGTDASGCSLTSATLRGYTAQEMMDSFCLVNLNGRIYDPTIGRFLSADPTVPYPMDGQSFNRFSYVENNPLSLVDPSGYTDE